MRYFFEIIPARLIAAPLVGLALTLGACDAEPAMSPRQAADRYVAALGQMLDAVEAVHDAASARAATRTMAEATRERIRQQSAVEAMSAGERAVYARLLAGQAEVLGAQRVRLDAALSSMMANPAYVQAFAANTAAPQFERR